MTTINTTYTENLRTVSIHLRSGSELLTDAPVDNQGLGQAYSPTDLLATALGTCMLTIMGITARKHGMSIDNTKVEVTKVMASNPRRVAKVEVVLHMPANGYSEKERALLHQAAVGCPVALSLDPELEQVVRFVW